VTADDTRLPIAETALATKAWRFSMQHDSLKLKAGAEAALRRWALRAGAVAASVALLALSAPIIVSLRQTCMN
jgi:hypothetical protein